MTDSDKPRAADYPHLNGNHLLVAVAASKAADITIRAIANKQPHTHGDTIQEVLEQLDNICKRGELFTEFEMIYYDPEE